MRCNFEWVSRPIERRASTCLYVIAPPGARGDLTIRFDRSELCEDRTPAARQRLGLLLLLLGANVEMHMTANENRSAFVMRLFESYYDRVFAFVRKSAAADVAEDVTQEVFIRLLQHPRLEELTLSVSYLIKIAHNLLRRRHSRSMRLRELLESAIKDDLISRKGHPERFPTITPLTDIESEQLKKAMTTLTSDEQDAIRLIVWEGKSYEHAAKSLDVTVTTINNWKHRGLAKLRKHADRAQTKSRIHQVDALIAD